MAKKDKRGRKNRKDAAARKASSSLKAKPTDGVVDVHAPLFAPDVGTSASHTQSVRFEGTTGALPPPGMLKGFDDVVENGAERIFRMAEQAADDRSLEIRGRARNETTGHYFSMFMTIVVFAVAIWFIFSGWTGPGMGLFALQFGAMVGVRFQGQKLLIEAIKSEQ